MSQAVAQAVSSGQTALNQATDTHVKSDQAFSRHSRLLSAADYAQVFKKNRRFSDHFWTVLVHSSEQGQARLGLAIAKKRAKRAVDRNKLKRIVRESFRNRQLHLAGYELVVMNRDAATSASPADLRLSIDKLLAKIEKSGRQSVK